MEHRTLMSDVLIIGGGTAGCYAAIWLAEHTDLTVTVADKADIRRSGCLAAGVNALNAYITPGHVPMDYVRYASQDAGGIVREDLLYDISCLFNEVTQDMERRGLTILKDENGEYVSRGWRNLKINGENIKPILASEVFRQERVKVTEHVNITDLRISDGVRGAYGFGIRDGAFYEFQAKAVLVATGGAAGLYRPNNPEGQPHQMWYSPFNTGAGYAMGILAGAEMTTFEMRFIALRCKDTIAPTGTIAQGVGARQVNARGEDYEKQYGISTSQRLWGTVSENREGRGPCFLHTRGIDARREEELYKAYLNMAPLQTLKWIDSGDGPASADVEIEGTEPYIVGGHTASGYWIGRDRQTTLPGLFAAGDVAGGQPQKYVTGALAEGKLAARGIAEFLAKAAAAEGQETLQEKTCQALDHQAQAKKAEYEGFLTRGSEPGNDSLCTISAHQLEVAMQKVMDEYAGGIKTDYRYTEAGLDAAKRRIESLQEQLGEAAAREEADLLDLYEVRDRLVCARVLIAHLRARKETRWHGFAENADHPGQDPAYRCYINSVMEDGSLRIIRRDLIHMEEDAWES